MKYLFASIACLFLIFSEAKASVSDQSKLEEAEANFSKGNYWDAFLLYHKIAESNSTIYVSDKLEKSKTAMVLLHNFTVYRDLKKYPLAIDNLQKLVVINPSEPNKPEIARLALLQAKTMQIKARAQYFRVDAEIKLKEASKYYQLAMQEGVDASEILPNLKIVEMQLRLVSQTEPAKTENKINLPKWEEPANPKFEEISKPKTPIERSRKVMILEE